VIKDEFGAEITPPDVLPGGKMRHQDPNTVLERAHRDSVSAQLRELREVMKALEAGQLEQREGQRRLEEQIERLTKLVENGNGH
jgi:hypothetical protein